MGKLGLKIRSLLLFISVFLSSCIGTKYLKKDESILYKQEIKSEGSLDDEALNGQLSQSPNSRLLKLPITHLVHVYKLGEHYYDSAQINQKKQRLIEKYDRKINKAKSTKRKNKLNAKKIQKVEKKDLKLKEGNQLMRSGEELAVFDSSKISTSTLNLKNYLFSKGYFRAQITTNIERRKRRVYLTYQIEENKPYTIDSIVYNIKDPKVAELFEANLEDQQLLDKQYDQTLLSMERDRVFDLLADHGYFNFKRPYVLFEVDSTTLGEQRLVVRENIANPPGQEGHKVFRLDSVIFSNEATLRDIGGRRARTYQGVTYSFTNDKYSERLLSWRVFLEKDSLYSKGLTLETQRQLSYLDIFKFVNINYDSTGGQFIAHIFTSPLKKYQTSTEMGLSVLDQARFPGPFFNFNAKSRNIFSGLEIIQLDAGASIQGISSVNKDQNSYSRFQYGGQLSVTFPQFLFPLKDEMRSDIGKYNPRTKLTTGINFEDRKDEYVRTTFNGSMSYIWQVRVNSQFTLKPFDLSYINSNNSNSFDTTLLVLEQNGNRSLASAFQSSLVSFSAFSARVNNNNYGIASNNSSLVQGYVETGGNLLDLIGEDARNKVLITQQNDTLEYYKYVKFNLDFRKNHRLSSESSLAYRVNMGAAYSDGPNNALPYEKYFFAGGSNSIRAWQPRRLGPGAYAAYDTNEGSSSSEIIVDNTREQPGDIIFETSLEYRHDLIGFIDYALFIDAGNVWLWKSETVDRTMDGNATGTNDDGIFRLRTFPREIAVGAGFGLRFDFSFLVLRFDVAYKVVDPGYPLGSRFILGDYQFNDLWDFRHKGSINIGIGYPF